LSEGDNKSRMNGKYMYFQLQKKCQLTRNDRLSNWAECKIQWFQKMLFSISEKKDISCNQENNG
jgi:hypothetical protein